MAAVSGMAQVTPAPELKTDKDKFSYALGMQMGENFRRDGLDLDVAIYAKALAETLNGGKLALTAEEKTAILMAARDQFVKKQQEIQQAKAKEAQAAGAKFLEANKTKEGVVALPSGLQYKILKQGDGPKPTAESTVVCSYKGTLIDGTEFDNSANHGGTATFPVNGVIKGWTEALQLMQVGSKWQLFIPSELGYGGEGSGQIPANSVLVFEVELVSIK